MKLSQGAVLTEFTLVMAFLFLLAGGAIELSRYASETATLTHASEEGIAYLHALPPASLRHGDLTILARNIELRLANILRDASDMNIAAEVTRADNPFRLTLTIQRPFTFHFPIDLNLKQVRATATIEERGRER